MAKKLLFFSGLLLAISLNSNAQCVLTMDSVLIGSDTGAVSLHYYNGAELERILYYNQWGLSGIDSFFYGNSLIVKKQRGYYNNGVYYIAQTVNYSYSGNLLVRMDASGTNNGGWSMSHDFFYSGSTMTDIVLDPVSISGNPEGMVGSFRNLVWSGGNAISIDLVADVGNGLDTFECNVAYDNKLNVGRFVFPGNAGSFMDFISANNIVTVSLKYNEVLGVAGTLLLNRTYTYYPSNEVSTLTSNPSVFESEMRSWQYYFDCGSRIGNMPHTVDEVFYPVPAKDILFTGFEVSTAELTDMLGKVYPCQTNGNNVSLEKFPAGIYFIRATDSEGKVHHQKICVKH